MTQHDHDVTTSNIFLPLPTTGHQRMYQACPRFPFLPGKSNMRRRWGTESQYTASWLAPEIHIHIKSKDYLEKKKNQYSIQCYLLCYVQISVHFFGIVCLFNLNFKKVIFTSFQDKSEVWVLKSVFCSHSVILCSFVSL